MTIYRQVVEQEIPHLTSRKPSLAGLVDPTTCKTEVFVDRDVSVLRCLEDRNCKYKQKYLHMNICSCPAVINRSN